MWLQAAKSVVLATAQIKPVTDAEARSEDVILLGSQWLCGHCASQYSECPGRRGSFEGVVFGKQHFLSGYSDKVANLFSHTLRL